MERKCFHLRDARLYINFTELTCQILDKGRGVYNIEMNFGDAEIREIHGISTIQMFFGTVNVAKMLYVAGKLSLFFLTFK